MKLSVQALVDALRRHVASGFASAFHSAALSASPGMGDVHDDVVGPYLITALLGWSPPELPLHSAHFAVEGGWEPYPADARPLPPTFANAVAAPLAAGARAHFLDPDWVFEVLSVTESEAPLCGNMQLRLVAGGALLTVQYGQLSPSLPLVSHKMISADALFAAGREANERSQPIHVNLLRGAQISAPPPSGAIN